MSEEPRDNLPANDQADDDSYDDEISLDELEGDSAGFSSAPYDFTPPEAPPEAPDFESPFPDPTPTHEPEPPAAEDAASAGGTDYDDEVTFDELDDDVAGLFEVYATPAPAPPSDDSMYEVEATSSEPPQSAPPVQPPPAQPPPQQHAPPASPVDQESIRRLHNVEVEVIATLGTTRMRIRDILGLQIGSVVELHRMVGESVDVTLNGRLIARGEVVVVDEKFAIRVHEIVGNGE